MPNWVRNSVKFYGTEKEKVFESILNEDGEVDFERVVPMPEHIYRGSLGKEEYEKYGKNNWYDWSRENWGTKWNAWDTNAHKELYRIEFCTAWSTPYNFFLALSKKFPSTKFTVSFADECYGENCGILEFKNGACVKEEDKDNNPRFSRSVWNK